MKQTGLCCLFISLGLMLVQAQDVFQLAPPLLKYPSVFFEKKVAVELQFAQSGTQIHFTTNGQEPAETDPVYTRPIVLKKDATTLKARVFGKGFLPSETVEATFFKRGIPISQVIHDQPDDRYRGSGYPTLTDGSGGVAVHTHPSWLGFQQDKVNFELRLEKPKNIRQLLLHVLENQGAWIFLPQRIDVFYQNLETKEFVWMATKVIDPVKKSDKAACQAILMTFNGKIKADRLLIKVYPLAAMPDGHPGKGKPAWLFLDEIILY